MNDLTSYKQQAVQKSFGRAAKTYDEAAVLQREVATRMLERLDYIKASPKRILDLGCATGEYSARLARMYKKAQVISLDIAEPMLKEVRRRSTWWYPIDRVCGDIQALPIADNSVDLIFSSLALQWCGSLDAAFSEFRRVLKPGGFVMFSTFGPDTLKELRASWAEVDDERHVHDFVDMHDIGDEMLRAGLSQPVMDVETLTLTYNDAYALMRELKDIGAHNIAKQRNRNLTTRSRLKAVVNAYEQFRIDGVLPASYEIVYGHAWCDETKVGDPGNGVSIEALRGSLE